VIAPDTHRWSARSGFTKEEAGNPTTRTNKIYGWVLVRSDLTDNLLLEEPAVFGVYPSAFMRVFAMTSQLHKPLILQ